MPIIHIDWFEGRTVEVKREIADKVTSTIVTAIGCPAESVTIVFSDHPRTDIAKAGKLLSD